jgi:iron complex transport system substrate-binding protein
VRAVPQVRLLAAVVLALGLAPAGCSAPATSAGTGPPAGEGGFPVTITHALGKAEIPAAPTRVVTWGFGSSGQPC